MHHSRARGFSIIELLVVIAIIGILSTVVLAVVSKARQDGRNAKRKSDLKQLQVAITEFYDNPPVSVSPQGVPMYPTTGGVWFSSVAGDTVSNNGGNWIPGLTPLFLPTLPKEPGVISRCGAGTKAAYWYKSDGTQYKLKAHCGPEDTWGAGNPFYDPADVNSWMVCAGNIACTTW